MNPMVVAARRNLGVTQAQLAQLLNVHPLTVSRWERGTLDPNPWHVGMLEAFVKVQQHGIASPYPVMLKVNGPRAALYFILRDFYDSKKKA